MIDRLMNLDEGNWRKRKRTAEEREKATVLQINIDAKMVYAKEVALIAG